MIRSAFALGIGAVLAAAGTASARPYSLDELLEIGRKNNPGIAAAAQQTEGVRAQLTEARRSLLPTGDLTSAFAPVPRINCIADTSAPPNVDPDTWRLQHCSGTDTYTVRLQFEGVFTRTEVHLVQPLYTFGKIAAGVSAAEAGISASRSREQGAAADVALNIKKAYWGWKLARESLDSLNEGLGYVDDGQKAVEKSIKEGDTSPTERQRVAVLRATVLTRKLEAEKAVAIARAGLRALLGAGAPADLEPDAEPLEALAVPPKPVAQYQDEARRSRPEVRALDELVKVKRELASLEWRKQLPDLVLLGQAAYAYASSIDYPKNAFYSNPFNGVSAGVAAALRMPLDLFVKNARAARLQAEAEEARLRREEALGGVGFEVQKAYADMIEAQKRIDVNRQGEKAGRIWLTGVSQKMALGTGEMREFADALIQYFLFRYQALQAVYDFDVAAATLTRAIGVDVTKL
jgi:outer membrane protein TolC